MLWRWCGWLVPVALLPFALILLSFPAQVADRSSRIGSSAAAVLVGALMLYLAWMLARLWFTSVRSRRS